MFTEEDVARMIAEAIEEETNSCPLVGPQEQEDEESEN